MLQIPIIAVTAYDDESTADNCMALGIQSILNKPVSITKLDKIIQKYYYKKSSLNSLSMIENRY